MLSYEKTHIIRPAEKPASRGELLRWAGWFFLANGLLALLISVRYLGAAPFPTGEYTAIFTTLAFIGHFAALAFIGSLLMFLPILLFPRRALVFALGIILALTFIAGITLDTFVFNQYRSHFNGTILKLLLDGGVEKVFAFSASLWGMLALMLIALIGFQVWLSRWLWAFVLATPHRSLGYLASLVLFTIFFAQNFFYAWAHANTYTPITQQLRTLPGYSPLTADRWFIDRGWAEPKTL